jgi:hypothetical protein
MNRCVSNAHSRSMSFYHPDRVLPWFLGSLSALVGLLLLLPHAQNISLETLTQIASAILVILLAVNVRNSPKGIHSVSSIYLIVFAVFHFGLAMPYALGLVGADSDLREQMLAWFETPSSGIAVILAAIAVAGFVTGKILAILRGFSRQTPDEGGAVDRALLANAGAILLLVGCAAWFIVVVVLAGVDIFGSYEGFYTSISDYNVAYIENMINLGAVITLLRPRSPLRLASLFVFGIWAAAVMALGHRGAILFPLAGAIAVLGMQKALLSPTKVLVGAIVILGLTAAIRELRATGLRDAGQVAVAAKPLDGLLELGSSIRPVRETVLWIQEGDSHSWGASFWAPFDRALYHIIPGWSRPPAKLDERLLGNVVEQRVGSIGFSSVAEGYYNFGAWGMAVEFLLLGFLLGRMDFWPALPYQQTIVGVCLIPLLTHVRNTFTPVPAQIILGLVFIHLLCFLVQLTSTGEPLSKSLELKPFRNMNRCPKRECP